MNQRPEVSQNNGQLNESGFVAAIREVVREAMQPLTLMPAPIGCKNGAGPPKAKSEPRELVPLPATRKTPLQDSAKPIVARSHNGKLPGIPAALASEELIDLVADGALQKLPEIQEEPTILPEETAPLETIPCKVQLRLALSAEGASAGPSFCHFDRSDTFCRLAIIALNVDNPATRSALDKHNVGAIRFFAAAALAKSMLRDPRSALVETLLAELKTRAGIAPNQGLGVAAFARRLAQSALLGPIERLPIFGPAFASALGCSFRLGEIVLRIPTSALGAPSDKQQKEER